MIAAAASSVAHRIAAGRKARKLTQRRRQVNLQLWDGKRYSSPAHSKRLRARRIMGEFRWTEAQPGNTAAGILEELIFV